MTMRLRTVCVVTATVGGIIFLSTAYAETFPFSTDFSSTGFENTDAVFTLDTGNGVLNYVEATGANAIRSTSVFLTDAALETSNITVSTRFTINSKGIGGTGNSSIGFGLFGTTSNFPATAGNPNYLADWTTTGVTAGTLRILAQVDASGFSATNVDTDGANPNGSSVVDGSTYQLKLAGTYSSGTLNMTLSLFDGLGVQVGSSATAADPSPLTGDYFGYRNRFANTATNVNISYDNFSIGPTPVGTLGDYNNDGAVNAADYVVWRRHLGTTFTLPHEDPNATPNEVTPEDYDVWRAHFGEGALTGASLGSNSAVGVPEPSMLMLVVSTIVSIACLSRRLHGRNIS